MSEEIKVEETTVAKKTWKETVGAFLTAKGAIIGASLVIIGSALQGTTSWIDAIVNIIKGFFGG
jgi:hypothetical protein